MNLPKLSDKDGIRIVIRDVSSNQEWGMKYKSVYWLLQFEFSPLSLSLGCIFSTSVEIEHRFRPTFLSISGILIMDVDDTDTGQIIRAECTFWKIQVVPLTDFLSLLFFWFSPLSKQSDFLSV